MTKNAKNRIDKEAHERINKMARVFKEMQKMLAKLEARQTQRNAQLEQDSHDLHQAMAALEENIAHAPDVERQLKDEILGLKSQLPPLQDRLDELEAEFMLNVSAELGDNDKPLYTNDKTRGSAVTLAKGHSDEYQETLEKVRAKEFAVAKKEHALAEYEKQDKANRALLRAYEARLNNLTARF